jgi:hypothetical protein
MSWFGRLLFGDAQSESYEERLARQANETPATTGWKRADGSSAPSASASQSAEVTQPIEQPASDPYRTTSGKKVLPLVSVERVESHVSNDKDDVEIWIHLKNESDFEVEVTRVNVLNQHVQLSRFLKPDQAYEVKVYSGDTPHTDAYRKVEIQYKIAKTGDYFQSDHRVDYHFEQEDGKDYYLPEEFVHIPPVRDI